MTFKIERDGTGREVIVSDRPEVGGKVGRDTLIVEHIMYDAGSGHGYVTNDAHDVLFRLSPQQAKMIDFYERERGRAEPDIFAGDPPDG